MHVVCEQAKASTEVGHATSTRCTVTPARNNLPPSSIGISAHRQSHFEPLTHVCHQLFHNCSRLFHIKKQARHMLLRYTTSRSHVASAVCKTEVRQGPLTGCRDSSTAAGATTVTSAGRYIGQQATLITLHKLYGAWLADQIAGRRVTNSIFTKQFTYAATSEAGTDIYYIYTCMRTVQRLRPRQHARITREWGGDCFAMVTHRAGVYDLDHQGSCSGGARSHALKCSSVRILQDACSAPCCFVACIHGPWWL